MTTYSKAGYLAALTYRRARTVLVEGKSDRVVISRLLLDFASREIGIAGSIVIDDASLLTFPGLARGNREKVIEVHREAFDAGLNLVSLVDREWEDLSTQPWRDERDHSHVPRDALFQTRGHSIENYLINPEYFLEYLSLFCAEHIFSISLERFSESFRGVLRQACAASLAFRGASLIGACSGVARSSFWAFDDRLEPDLALESLLSALRARGTTDDKLEEVRSAYAALTSDSQFLKSHELHLVAVHGRIGFELAWAAVAGMLRVRGVTDEQALEAVERGEFDRKVRFLADRWVRGGGAGLPAGFELALLSPS